MQLSSKAEFEIVPTSELYSFVTKEFKLPAFECPWHFHPECELTYIVRSSGRRFVGDNISPFGPGDLTLFGSDLPHCFWNDRPATDPKNYAHSLMIQFREECLGTDFLSRPEMDKVCKLLIRARRGLEFRGKVREPVREIMGKIIKSSGLERVIGLLTIFKLLLRSADCRVLSSPGFVPLLDQLAGERINRAYQFVFGNFTAALDHKTIARTVGMSQSAFCHYFKRVTGRTLSSFINEVRIGHARKLLIDSDRSIAEIAYASGYENLSNFNRHFHELTKMTPKEYRQQLAQDRTTRIFHS